MISKILIFKVILLSIALSKVGAVAVICYYANWFASRGITPKLLDANLCTHLNYAFVGLWENGYLRVKNEHLDIKQGLFKEATDLKKKNPKLKVLLSVGGASTGTQLFSLIASNATKRNAFIENATYFLSTYNFDGLDVDWEYPSEAEKDIYTNFLREIKEAFSSKDWLLTVAVPSSPKNGYDVKQMNKYVDIMSLMTYAFYGSWSSYTGQNSALFESSVENDREKHHKNLAACATNWLELDAERNKLAIGTAFYGRTFTLRDPTRHDLHAPVTGIGPDRGTPSYITICSKYSNWTRVWDSEQMNPYKYQGSYWLGYDDKESIRAKGEWIKNEGFFGVMVWHISADDVLGTCTGEKQQLLQYLNKSIK